MHSQRSCSFTSSTNLLLLLAVAALVVLPIHPAAEASESVDTSYIPSHSFAAMSIKVPELLATDQLRTSLGGSWLNDRVKELGVEMEQLERIDLAAFYETEKDADEPTFGMILRFKEPYDADSIGGTRFPRPQTKSITTATGSVLLLTREYILQLANEQTLVLARPNAMLPMMVAEKSRGPVVRTIAARGADHAITVAFRAQYAENLLSRQQFELYDKPMLSDLMPMIYSVDQATMVLDTKPSMRVALEITPSRANELSNLHERVDLAIGMAAEAYTSRLLQSQQGTTNASRAKLLSLMPTMTNSIEAKIEEDKVVCEVEVSEKVLAELSSMLSSARDQQRENIKQLRAINNLKQILLAMLNYESARRSFPPATHSEENEAPKVSWRTRLLPYMGVSNLYDAYDFDKPWDEGRNRAVGKQVPAVYQMPDSPLAKPGHTTFVALVGEETAFPPGNAVQLRSFTDGLSQTIVIVEADDSRAVPWSKPSDINYDPKNPLAGLPKGRPFLVGFGDGHVEILPADIDPKLFHKMVTRNGGEVIDRN